MQIQFLCFCLEGLGGAGGGDLKESNCVYDIHNSVININKH